MRSQYRKTICGMIGTVLICASYAHIPANAADSLVDPIEDILRVAEAAEARSKQIIYTPLRPYEPPYYVNCIDKYEFWGAAVVSAMGIGAVRQYTENAMTLSEIEYQLTWYSADGSEPAECLPSVIPEGCSYSPDEIIVCNAERELLEKLENDDNIMLLGTIALHRHEKNIFGGMDSIMVIPAEGVDFREGSKLEGEGYSLTLFSSDAFGKYRVFTGQISDDFGSEDDRTRMEKVTSFCEKLEQRNDVAFAWICGERAMNLHDNSNQLELSLIRHFGDTDGDGEVNLTDANAALLFYNLSEVAMVDRADYNLTAYETIAADVNRDGIVDTKDANAIMLYYNYTTVSQVDGITWYDILKIPGVPGAPE